MVCRSKPQAKLVHYWFKRNSKITTGLVLSDCEDTSKQNEMNILNQLSFREYDYPDILIVHFMPTTGYDVERLKKNYLFREGDLLLSAKGTEIKPTVFDNYTE